MGIRHRTRKILLSGACWPTVLPYRKNGKASEQVIVLSSDYFGKRLQPEDGKNPLGIG